MNTIDLAMSVRIKVNLVLASCGDEDYDTGIKSLIVVDLIRFTTG